MEKNKANQLVRKLGMEHELAPLLDSDEAYTRFENAVAQCLDSYKIKPAHYIRTVRSKHDKNIINWKIEDFRNYAELFKRNYGIECEAKTCFDLSTETHGEPDLTVNRSREGFTDEVYQRRIKLAKSRKYSEHSSKTSWKIRKVLELLRQKHKSDIWYRTL